MRDLLFYFAIERFSHLFSHCYSPSNDKGCSRCEISLYETQGKKRRMLPAHGRTSISQNTLPIGAVTGWW